ncbi:pilin [Candidatus Parcubacteria bacterium]|nr:pilin [Candidatus Parcubacteria bacterium]
MTIRFSSALVLAFIVITVPSIALAQLFPPIVPQNCGGANQPSCGFTDLLALANNIITFLIRISAFLAALAFVYVGWLYVTSGGDSGKKSEAKRILINVVIGFVLALAAWLIVKLILQTLGFNSGGQSWIGNIVQ